MHKFLITGLGNIGAEYAHTRHNIGFDIADAFVQKHGGTWRIDRLAEVCEVKIKGRVVLLIKPTTYMNLSGRAYRYWLEKEKIAVENSLTLVDEIAIGLDRIRLRPSGSHAGHNGLKDIELALGHSNYPRLRFGIGNQFAKGKQVDFVLGQWTENEKPVIKLKIEACIMVIEDFVLSGLAFAMNKYNNLVF
ncbi:MAG: aminoacyl-tRNA hydrolase [Chitinophagaceae bacterium]|jgi:PTH1 family peptidyl-tRNA hydrolase|nr:aminoacyl-tRNA hydrolase [Chitinophagaceae bacterium]